MLAVNAGEQGRGGAVTISSFFDRLRGRRELEPPAVALDEPEDMLFGAEPLRILISPLSGDADNRAARHIHDRLAGRLGIAVRLSERPLTAPGADNTQPVFLSMAVELGRRWLKREGADVLIWGDAVEAAPLAKDASPGQSWRLRFLGASTPVQPLGATLSALERLEVPAFFDAGVGDLIFGAALAAVNVESSEGLRARASLFGPTLEKVKRFAEGDSLGTVAECATIQACYAALLLLDGARTGDVITLEKAVSVYRGALILGDDAFSAHEKAMLGAHMADAMALIADTTNHAKLADKTVEYYRLALGMVRKDIFADDYAALKTRLGLALHIMAEISRDTRHLDEAAEAFTHATAIWTISEAPERWADIQNSLGGLLITMGKLTQQPSLFDKAVAVFIKIAEVMNRRRAPLVWATTLANIGAALKEKGEAVRSPAYLKQAVAAFDQAEQVFAELNLEGNARLVETQRAQALQLLRAPT
jgi:tetratricopeptide (TPR) repeat protein